MDEIDKIADEIDSTINGDDDQHESDSGDDDSDELSKEEIAEEFDVQFVKTQGGNTQHLVKSTDEGVVCGAVDVTSDTVMADAPSPFDPICEKCRGSILGMSINESSGQTYNDLRRWLADEIEGVDEPKANTGSDQIRKTEAAAIIDYIQSLKEQMD